MKHLDRWLLVMGWVLIFACAGGPEAEASLGPGVADFGDVLKGETKSIPVYVTNYGTESSVDVFLMLENMTPGFTLETFMLMLNPGETKTVIVTYVSSGEGEVSDTLVVTSDGGSPPERVLLTANGITAGAPVDIQSVLAFFQQAVDEGTLTGVGPGQSADHRLNALHNIILEAASFIRMGEKEQACQQLKAAAKKISSTDETGNRGHGPAVFAEGESAGELAGLIQAISEGLCGGDGTEVASVNPVE